MTKADFMKNIAERSGLSKKDVEVALDAILSELTSFVKNDESMTFKGFGKFYAKKSEARVCRNPQTGEPLNVPAKKVLAFKAAWSEE